MNSLLHPKFRLNGKRFPTLEALKKHALQLINKGENFEVAIGKFIQEWLDKNDFITVQTSGSTGTPKKIKHYKKNVSNSALATVNYFDLSKNTKALLCLPAEYIAGKMMLTRAMLAGWDLYCVNPRKNPLEEIQLDFDFTAMVPYQVFHSLPYLKRVKKLIIGGGAVSWKLEKQLQGLKTIIFVTYGMTETISHIAVRSLNGPEKSTNFSALPSVRFSLTENDCLQISAPGISEEPVETNDVVELISPTSFKFIGRIDNIINTGGIKVHPENIEEKLSLYLKDTFFIASEKDDALGERVILIIETKNKPTLAEYSKVFETLSPYEKPKKIYTLPQFDYTDTGKIKRTGVLKLIGELPFT